MTELVECRIKTEFEGIGASRQNMDQGGNPSFKDCQRFGLKRVSGKTIPIRD